MKLTANKFLVLSVALLLGVLCVFGASLTRAKPFAGTTVYFDSVSIPAHGTEQLVCPIPCDAAKPAELPQGVIFCVIGSSGDVIRLYNSTGSKVVTGETRWKLFSF